MLNEGITLQDCLATIAQALDEPPIEQQADGRYVLALDGMTLFFTQGPKQEPLMEYSLLNLEEHSDESEALLKKALRYNFVFFKRKVPFIMREKQNSVYVFETLIHKFPSDLMSQLDEFINNIDILKKLIHNQ